jgi:hypothetical protein
MAAKRKSYPLAENRALIEEALGGEKTKKKKKKKKKKKVSFYCAVWHCLGRMNVGA